jgi:hypothetical protein
MEPGVWYQDNVVLSPYILDLWRSPVGWLDETAIYGDLESEWFTSRDLWYYDDPTYVPPMTNFYPKRIVTLRDWQIGDDLTNKVIYFNTEKSLNIPNLEVKVLQGNNGFIITEDNIKYQDSLTKVINTGNWIEDKHEIDSPLIINFLQKSNIPDNDPILFSLDDMYYIENVY